MTTVASPPSLPQRAGKFLTKFVLWATAWVLAFGCALWAFGALYYDANRLAACLLGLALLVALIAIPRQERKLAATLAAFLAVLIWWRTLQPSQSRNWQPDVSQTGWAEVRGDEIVFHNVRNCEYRTETDYTPRWETRTVRLSQLLGVDLAVNYWGSPYMAHPIASFQFADAPPLCFSIETRKELGESYSAIGGIYRQFELFYVVADERDVIRVRTNFRQGEDVYLYRTTLSAQGARERLLEYVAALNALHERPRWYNALTTNCTTTIRSQRYEGKRMPWDWRILVNGKGDQMMFGRGFLLTGGLPFEEFKRRSHINAAAKASNNAPDFSTRIRQGCPFSSY